jgi:DNA-binding NarL/FixJ family response regulator
MLAVFAREEDQQGPKLLIAAEPDRMRDSLHLLLKTVRGISIVGLVDDSSAALRMISERHPALVLLDTNLLGEEMATVLEQIKADESQSRCLVLADTFEQQREAGSAGADAALVKGFSMEELFQTIEELLQKEKQGR